MSRIGKLPIIIPPGVTVTTETGLIKVVGPKGELSLRPNRAVKVEQQASQLLVSPVAKTVYANEQYGLTRTLLANMVAGVSEGFRKQLEISGVGYRAQVNGRTVTLNVGYSHPIEYKLPEGIDAVVEGNTITISGFSKQLTGQVAAEIRAYRKPEPYKGKGIKYANEWVRRKAGKTAGK